jgi:hypothetical protein
MIRLFCALADVTTKVVNCPPGIPFRCRDALFFLFFFSPTQITFTGASPQIDVLTFVENAIKPWSLTLMSLEVPSQLEFRIKMYPVKEVGKIKIILVPFSPGRTTPWLRPFFF